MKHMLLIALAVILQPWSVETSEPPQVLESHRLVMPVTMRLMYLPGRSYTPSVFAFYVELNLWLGKTHFGGKNDTLYTPLEPDPAHQGPELDLPYRDLTFGRDNRMFAYLKLRELEGKIKMIVEPNDDDPGGIIHVRMTAKADAEFTQLHWPGPAKNPTSLASSQ